MGADNADPLLPVSQPANVFFKHELQELHLCPCNWDLRKHMKMSLGIHCRHIHLVMAQCLGQVLILRKGTNQLQVI